MSRVVMNSPIVKRSIIIDGHKTSVSLEDEFWHGRRRSPPGAGFRSPDSFTRLTGSARTETYPRPSGCSCWSTTAAKLRHSEKRPSPPLMHDAACGLGADRPLTTG